MNTSQNDPRHRPAPHDVGNATLCLLRNLCQAFRVGMVRSAEASCDDEVTGEEAARKRTGAAIVSNGTRRLDSVSFSHLRHTASARCGCVHLEWAKVRRTAMRFIYPLFTRTTRCTVCDVRKPLQAAGVECTRSAVYKIMAEEHWPAKASETWEKVLASSWSCFVVSHPQINNQHRSPVRC